MLKIQGRILGVKVSVPAQGGIRRTVSLEFGGDAVLDEIQELMRRGENLNISFEPQQLKLGAPAIGPSR